MAPLKLLSVEMPRPTKRKLATSESLQSGSTDGQAVRRHRRSGSSHPSDMDLAICQTGGVPTPLAAEPPKSPADLPGKRRRAGEQAQHVNAGQADCNDDDADSRDGTGNWGGMSVEPSNRSDGDPADGTQFNTKSDVAALAAGWANYVEQLWGKEAQASAEDVAVARELSNAPIGTAYIHFVGLGNVHGVINLENNPNARGNLRGLTETHVDLLHQILRRPNGKKDHELPIYIMVDEDHIEPALRSRMKSADAFNPMSALPLLELVCEHQDCKASLENELWVRMLREVVHCPYSVLLNGHHRIRAMLHISKEIFDDWELLKKRVMEGEGDEEDFGQIARDILQQVDNNTWRCVIYNSKKLTEAGKTALMRNEHERPAKGMGNGEKAWWLAKKFDAKIEQEIDRGQGEINQITVLNIIQARWCAEISSKMLMTGQDDEAEVVKTKSDTLKDITGDEPASQLFFNPLSMEMVMDIKPVLCVFDHNLDHSWAIEMLRPSGGPLIMHFWLDAHVLISIFDVEKGEHLAEAEAWLQAEPKLMAGGYPAAAGFFDSFHMRAETFLPYLKFYKESLTNKFGVFYTKVVTVHAHTGRPFIDKSNPEAVLAVCTAFNDWGHWLQGQAKHLSDWTRYVGTSARLFAYLLVYWKGVKGGLQTSF